MTVSQERLTRTSTPLSGKLLRMQILEYYRLIDQNKIDDILELFSDDAQYLRCGETYRGYEQIAHFYKVERKIKGTHTINDLWIIGQTGIVEGTFAGWGEEGQPKVVNFADFFIFNPNHKIQERRTYLMLGSSYVKR